MGLGISILLVAAGAVLLWAVEASIGGIDVDALGAILLIVGIIGAVLSLIFWSSWGGVRRRDERVVHDR